MLAIYTRLSKEDKDSTSIQNQIREGKEFASKLKGGYKLYNEGEGISGGAEIKDRPQLFTLLQDIRSNDIDKVWFRSQNRLERNSSTYAIFISEAQKYKVDVYFNDKLLDFDNPSDNLLGTITSAVNQYQKDLQAFQTKRTLRDNIKEGKVWSVVAYGYKSENGYLVIDEDESLIIKRIFNESLKGVGTRKIAEIFNDEGILTRYNKIGKGTIEKINKQTKRVTKSRTKDISWSGNTIRNIITNTLYKGERKFSGDVYESPIIINPILWQEVNDNLKKNRNNSGKQVDHKYLLKGKLICSKCGRNYYGRRRVDLSDNFYMCSSKRIKNQNCGNRSINITVLENLIWKRFFADKNLKTVVDRFFKTNDTATILYDLDAKLTGLNKDLSKSRQEKQNAIKLAISGVLSEDDVKPEIDRIKTETIEIEIKIKQLEEQIFFYNNSVSKINEIGKDLDFSDVNISFNDKRELINKYIDFIEIHYLESSYVIFIAFNIKDLDAETYIVDRNYNLAYDTCEKIIIPLSDKFIKYDLNTQEIKAKELLGKIPNESTMDLDLGRVMWDGHYLLNS
jgi:DNA invertase Pin-like site-specific DNA recombinase